MEHVWNMTQLSTKRDDYQRRLKGVQKEGEVLDIIRSECLVLSSGKQKEEMTRLREENSILKEQLDDSQQEITQTRMQAERDIQQVSIILKKTQQTLQNVMGVTNKKCND